MDIKLNFIDRGSGENLILLHGNGESLKLWANNTSYFEKKYRVIAIDTRGHGESPRGDKPFTIEQFSEDLYDFMVENHIRKANILGFSDGANIACMFAIKHPEMVKRLILNGAKLYPDGVKGSFQKPLEMAYKIALKKKPKEDEKVTEAELLGLMARQPNINPEDLKVLIMPTLVIVGDNDMIKPDHTKLIYDSLPNAKMAVLEGDHFIAYKEYKAYNQTIERFLQDMDEKDLVPPKPAVPAKKKGFSLFGKK